MKMAVSAKRKIGDQGEEVACQYLKGRGFSVLERNYWKPWGEIDIVAKKDGILRFFEVKTVSHGTIRPEENVHPAKLKRLSRAIQTYLLQRKVPESIAWQIDVACVTLNMETKQAKVELLENVIM